MERCLCSEAVVTVQNKGAGYLCCVRVFFFTDIDEFTRCHVKCRDELSNLSICVNFEATVKSSAPCWNF